MIDLKPAEKQLACDIIRLHVQDQPYRVLVFGSRATGKARRYSDVDLAFIGTHKMPLRIRSHLAEAFEDSKLPYTVDLVDYATADEHMRQQITRDGEELLVI